ncbi:hypothetical protein T4D_7453 [Trichinella pseudospiralis]|uniref:Uncharacterized protein n=1 Tax=Trichinella pseudospiralis TaxID=6337 RepID=A0A0V1FBH7_TRIPS|nr:hypothetical protein T4D_7453 [Trichinella pseudospiralis]
MFTQVRNAMYMIGVNRKEALQTGGWSTAASALQFQTLDSDWSTSPEMSGNAEYPPSS